MELCFSASGVRKSAWTREEDILLKQCVEKYGEGKWRLVPDRAGLNRCRKSCRLRWMNYLKPDIKRGAFAEDEVDLILRLHKLLGNRIPGRTANDVKNYWNCHLRKKVMFSKERDVKLDGNDSGKRIVTKTNAIKPRPRSFTRESQLQLPRVVGQNKQIMVNEDDNNPPRSDNHTGTDQPKLTVDLQEDQFWWESLLSNEEIIYCLLSNEEIIYSMSMAGTSDANRDTSCFVQEPRNYWGDLTMDLDLWDLAD